MDRDPNTSPFQALPPVVVALAAIIGGIELLFSGATAGYFGGAQGIGWRINAISDYGFSAQVLDWMVATGQWPMEHLVRFLTYPLLHLNFTHALFVVVFILAIGKAISGAFSAWKLVVIFWAASIIGAVAYTVLLNSSAPLVGGYPGVYGMIGAFTFLLWVQARAVGEQPLRAFTLIGFLLGIQLLFGAIFGSRGDWVADLFGFAAGFGLSFVLIPGGWTRLRNMLRHR